MRKNMRHICVSIVQIRKCVSCFFSCSLQQFLYPGIFSIENRHRIQSRHTLVIDEVAQSDPRRGGCHRSGKGCHHYGPLPLFNAGEIWSKNTLESYSGLPHLFRERFGAQTALQVWEVMRFLSRKNSVFPIYKRKEVNSGKLKELSSLAPCVQSKPYEIQRPLQNGLGKCRRQVASYHRL